MLKFLVTMAATILFDLTVAIVIGVGIALILLVVRLSKLEINYEQVDPKRLKNPDVPLPSVYDNAEVVYITGSLIFANTQMITDMADRFADKSAVLFSMRGTSYMDISGAQAFLELIQTLREKEIPVYICGISDGVKEMVERSGIADCIGKENFYWSVENVLSQAS